ncbi:AraC family transcriptional regulator [Hoeflea sp. TYP-13]|uniref:AraC family transcriptional regulator n=1 Tax=Hoeflea sp. TYP-13 TaxID=3230023 RepID=UPI0034C65531
MSTALTTSGNTADVSPRDRLDYWHSLFERVWGAVSITPRQSSEFLGGIASRRLGNLKFNRIEFGSQTFSRTQSQARSVETPFYSFAFPAEGSAECQIGSTRAVLRPGSVYLLNNDAACRLTIPDYYLTNNIQIPAKELEARIGARIQIREFASGHNPTITLFVRQLAEGILSAGTGSSEEETGFLKDKIFDAIAFLLKANGTAAPAIAAEAAHRARVMAVVRDNYWREDLSPAIIATECGISRSYLHRLYRHTGKTIMQQVQDVRLEMAKTMLRDPARQPIGITDVAYYCGFRSISGFSRSFSNAYGVSPSQYRSAPSSR